MVATAVGIVREEGLLRLWGGLTPAVLRHVVYSGSRIVLYEHVRAHYMTGPNYPLWQSVLGSLPVATLTRSGHGLRWILAVSRQPHGSREGTAARGCS
jgi:solute carrier family 25 uncoupling protein 27